MLTECIEQEYQEQFSSTTLKEKDHWDVLGKDGVSIFIRPQRYFNWTISCKEDDNDY
ncbi:hypothetical protein C0J52_19112 [Blattella germanica]|nr:hypothetical protein C0J52_19112 [Blattella germanica]